MPTRNVNLTAHFEDFISQEIESGRFRDASEVMRAGLRLLEQQRREDEQKVAALRSLAAEGFQQLDQGQGVVLNGRQQLATFVREIGCRAAKTVKHRAKGA